MRRIALFASFAAALGWPVLVHRSSRTFFGPDKFFVSAAIYCAVWGGLSLLAMTKEARSWLLPRWRDLGVGLAAGALLFLVSGLFLYAFSFLLVGAVGRLLTRFAFEPWAFVALGLVIVPAEELFWRGVLQPRLSDHLGAARAVLFTAVLASAIAYVAQEPLLALATLPTYSVFGAMAAWRRSLWSPIACHALWSLLAAWVFPLGLGG